MTIKITDGVNYTKNYFKSVNAKTLLQTRGMNFHGINLSITYEKSGKSFDLPRYISKEMRQARKMNRFAADELKFPSITSFSRSSAEDYERLTSETLEASYSRVRWTNPKDGKTYYILKTGKSDNNNYNVRILDNDGGFIKEAEIKPKKIIIFEPDSGKNDFVLRSGRKSGLTHIDIIRILLRRNNPFADVDFHPYNMVDDIKSLQQKIDENTAALSCSFGIYNSSGFEWYHKLLSFLHIKKYDIIRNPKEIKSYLLDLPQFSGFCKKNVRYFFSSGNHGKYKYNNYLGLDKAEGVGALDIDGKLTEYSSSRSTYFTQHYEKGRFTIVETKYGYNLSGLHGTDIKGGAKFKGRRRVLGMISGTSFSTPVRAAKSVLNDMMEGIL